jgi:hypothetical protein
MVGGGGAPVAVCLPVDLVDFDLDVDVGLGLGAEQWSAGGDSPGGPVPPPPLAPLACPLVRGNSDCSQEPIGDLLAGLPEFSPLDMYDLLGEDAGAKGVRHTAPAVPKHVTFGPSGGSEAGVGLTATWVVHPRLPCVFQSWTASALVCSLPGAGTTVRDGMREGEDGDSADGWAEQEQEEEDVVLVVRGGRSGETNYRLLLSYCCSCCRCPASACVVAASSLCLTRLHPSCRWTPILGGPSAVVV